MTYCWSGVNLFVFHSQSSGHSSLVRPGDAAVNTQSGTLVLVRVITHCQILCIYYQPAMAPDKFFSVHQDLFPAISEAQEKINESFLILGGDLPMSPVGAKNDIAMCLEVVANSAELLKMNSTKLSLLLINSPMSVGAVQEQIEQLTKTCIPAIMTGYALCGPDVSGKLQHMELKSAVGRVLRELRGALQFVIDMAGRMMDGASTANKRLRTPEMSTGVLFEVCDRLIAMKTLDVGALALEKAEQYRDLVKDAIRELNEWTQPEEETDESENVIEGAKDDNAITDPKKTLKDTLAELYPEDESVHSGDQDEARDDESNTDSVEDMFGGPDKMPTDRPDIKKQIHISLARLEQIAQSYDQIIKYRLASEVKPTTYTNTTISTIDHLVDKLKETTSTVDELASSFYDLDMDEAISHTKSCTNCTQQALDQVSLSWQGKEDTLTRWIKTWQEADTNEIPPSSIKP